MGTMVFLVSGGSFFLALHKCYELNSVANHDITTLMMSFSGLIIGFLMCVFSDTIREVIEFDF
jgi:hypothetical protein